MTVQAFRINNFMGFEDSGWVEIKPVTLLFGRNSVGKSALMRALLLLRQSIEHPSDSQPFSFIVDDNFDFGGYRTLIREHDDTKPLEFWFRCNFPQISTLDEDFVFTERSEQTTGRNLLSLNIKDTNNTNSVAVVMRLSYQLFEQQIKIFAVDIYDSEGSIILRAEAPKPLSEDQAWKFWSEFLELEKHPSMLDNHLQPWVNSEIFTSHAFLPAIRLLDAAFDDEHIDSEAKNVTEFGNEYLIISRLLRDIRDLITDFLLNTIYIGPLRSEPKRYYYTAGERQKLDVSGEHSVRELYQAMKKDRKRFQDLSLWLERNFLSIHLEVKSLNIENTLHQLHISTQMTDTNSTDDMNSRPDNITEVGSGISQSLPVIIRSFFAPDHGMMLIEQPELHLHPNAQATLADLFIKIAMEQNCRFFVETHSEHILLRLRRRIAEHTVDPESIHGIPNSTIAAYFVDKRLEQSFIQKIEIDRFGEYEYMPAGFRDFFSDDMKEILEISKQARLARRNERKDE